MAIKGLTDGQAQFPQIGTLRKGGKKQKNKEGKEIQGKDLTHFRFDSKDYKANLDFLNAYGEEPTEVNIFLPYNTVEENFFTCKEEYDAGGLKHRCDGEIVSVLRIGKNYQRHFAAPCACPGKCKEVGRLKAIIPELKRFAYVVSETHSKNDIANLHQQLTAAEMTFGRLTGIPFVLRRVPETISTPYGQGDKRTRVEKWMLSIEVAPDWSELQLATMRSSALRMAQTPLLAGSEPQYLPSEPVALPQLKAQAEPYTIAPERGTVDYLSSEIWQRFMSAMLTAQSLEHIKECVAGAYKLIERGALPPIARNGIEREERAARDRIQSLASVGAITVPVEIDEEIDPGF